MARWMLEETGAPYRAVTLRYGPEMHGPDFLALNPMGKVPVLAHGARVVTETPAICAYLADAFPEAGLAPAPADRAAYYRWLFFAAGPLEAAVTNRSMGWDVPENMRARSGYGSFDAVVDTLEHAVAAGPYIAGERFTAADVYVGAQVGWGMMFGSLPERPAFRDYWSRLEQRPALLRASAADDAAAAALNAGATA
jgi:glutathione S-transferase